MSLGFISVKANVINSAQPLVCLCISIYKMVEVFWEGKNQTKPKTSGLV